MKTFRLIYTVLAVVLISSCQAEIWEPLNPDAVVSNNVSGLQLSISSQALLPIDASETKANGAVATDLNEILSTINDLNIKINLNDNTSQYFYCDKSSKPQNTSYIGGNNLADFSKNKLVQIHFDKIKSSQVKDIEIIANAQNSLDANTWKKAKEVGLYDPSKPYCLMYGRSTTDPSDNPHLAQPAPACKNYNISLRRTRAMVSVKILNGGLNKGVSITPLTLRICNIPEVCNIEDFASQTGNKLNEKNTNILKQEIPLTWGTLEGKDDNSTGGYVGFEHPVKPTSIPEDMKQYLVFPLENMQGMHNESNQNHSTKYPTGINNVADAKDSAKNHNYTYLEIEADYKYRELGDVKIGGTIIYRFFLGKNSTSNFDIEGNVYYRVNLNLLGYGGAQEDGKVDSKGNLVANDADASWRVDMQTTDWGFEQSDFDFDSHLIHGFIPVVGANDSWTFSRVLEGDGSTSWLVIRVNGFTGQDYANPTEIISKNHKGGNVTLGIQNGKLEFVVQPMYYAGYHLPANPGNALDPGGAFDEYSYKLPHNYRILKLEVYNKALNETKEITIKQYVPIPFVADGSIHFMERFEEYPDNQIGYPWGYTNDALKGDFYDENFQVMKFNSTPADYVDYAKNTVALSPNFDETAWPKPILYDDKGTGTIFEHAFMKGTHGGNKFQGNDAPYYAVPSQKILEAMFLRSAEQDPSWGPFQPLNIYSDYWTVEVPKTNFSTYYSGSTDRQYHSTDNRAATKRLRAFFSHGGININNNKSDWK